MTGQAQELLDSNVLIYAFTTDPRAETAERLLAKGCYVSLQGLNEFANVARRKLLMSWMEIEDAQANISVLCRSVLPMDLDTHSQAIELAKRYELSFYDALMIAAALRGGCTVLWSEDMHDGLVIDSRLRIQNPFK